MPVMDFFHITRLCILKNIQEEYTAISEKGENVCKKRGQEKR
jgi:hypothetical protein